VHRDLLLRYTGPVEGQALSCVTYRASEWPRLAPAWAELALASQSSFFLSEPWVGTWLDVFGAGMGVAVHFFENADGPVGACLLPDSGHMRSLNPLRRISLNASGEEDWGSTYIEFNNLLCRPGWEKPVAAKLAECLEGKAWDEFALDGMTPGAAYDELKRLLVSCDLEETWRPSPWVDLNALRRSGVAYELSLSAHRRKLLRQNIRAYSKLGPVRLSEAQDVGEALGMFEEMSRLNIQRGMRRDRGSAFQAPAFLAFHRRLIQRSVPNGSVQLLRLAAGSHTVGVVYNLVQGGKVCVYQCGFDYGLNPHLSPGVVTLIYAIQHCLKLGFDDWDFLAGAEEYKRNLSTGCRQLVWSVFRRPSIKVRLVQLLRRGMRRVATARRRSGVPTTEPGESS
jgi:Acetyltransferase (GNAT) domain